MVSGYMIWQVYFKCPHKGKYFLIVVVYALRCRAQGKQLRADLINRLNHLLVTKHIGHINYKVSGICLTRSCHFTGAYLLNGVRINTSHHSAKLATALLLRCHTRAIQLCFALDKNPARRDGPCNDFFY